MAVVRINGHDPYLGKYDSPESDEKNHQLLAGWHARGKVAPVATTRSGQAGDGLIVGERLIA